MSVSSLQALIQRFFTDRLLKQRVLSASLRKAACIQDFFWARMRRTDVRPI
jgi:hypothetical protein